VQHLLRQQQQSAQTVVSRVRIPTTVYLLLTDVMGNVIAPTAAMKEIAHALRTSSNVDQVHRVVYLPAIVVTRIATVLIAVMRSTVLVNYADRGATTAVVTCRLNGVTELTIVATTLMN